MFTVTFEENPWQPLCPVARSKQGAMPTLVLAVSIYGYYVFMNAPHYGSIERGESSAKFE